MILNSGKVLGILDLKTEYCEIKHGILQQNLCGFYKFESIDTLCE